MVRDFSQKTVQELYETIRVNVDEEEQWKVFDFVEDFFMEELESGDYINDINSYHLHMFDKHDVTTKKFDAIVEKAGKVDANYAAQIEGYCSLLGEYGKKFEAVCAMLQPEKLRLSPDKYREKLEGINTGYQNARDIHEQEQVAYEAELYDIEHTRSEKILDWTEDYLIRNAECVVLGNFTDEVMLLGVAGQITLGILDLDLPCDIRDIIADVKNLAKADDIKWDMIAMLALDLIGVIPVIGALKYSDEIGTLFKNADKVSVVARSTDGAGVLTKHADEAGAWLHGVKVFRYSGETAEAVASGEKLLKESGTIHESFADMMSPEDVWDLRNVGDALESGTSSLIDIDAIRPKLKTQPDTAFFWSGRTDGIGGAENAANIAKSRGGVTLESTIEIQNIVMPEWDFNNPSTMEAWDLASGAYAEQVSGEIRAVIGSELRPGNIWENVELPRLKNNPNVTKITTIDLKTGVENVVFER